MKKAFRLTSLLLIFVAILGLVSCAPSRDKAEEKMKKAGYVTVDLDKIAKYLVDGLDTEDASIETIMAFGKGDSALNAVANVLTGGDYVVVVYYKEKAQAKTAYEEIKEENPDTAMQMSGKCIFFGTEQGVKDFK